MTEEERDDVRRILVAFEDAAAWCEQLADLARKPFQTLDPNRSERIERMIRHLEANRRAVGAIRSRIGIPAARVES